MPAFASFKGGPLNENQVHVLADYLASKEFAQMKTATSAAATLAVPARE
jgi:hypothetical protein